LITITRRLALQLRTVLRRAFGSRGTGPALAFIADKAGLTVKCMSAGVAVEYYVPGELPTETLWLPFEFLGDVEGKKDTPVQLESTGKGRVTARWQDGSVPQAIKYDAKEPKGFTFPTLPSDFATNQPDLLQALAAAADTCDSTGIRFAVDHIQLRSEQGTIVATDGCQLLVQNRYQFPWTDNLLVPRSKVFASAELPHDLPVRVGSNGDWVAVVVGPWAIYLRMNKDGRFPDFSKHVPQIDGAKARCSFSQADAAFLAVTLPKLPCDDEFNLPVTLDLNGHVAIRAKGADSPRPTEVVLTGSSFSGESIRVHMNRNFLARAMRLGLRELSITDDKTAFVCVDDRRQYVWMPLTPEAAIPPAKDPIRIESPEANPETPVTQPRTRRKVSPVPDPISNPNGNAASNGNGQTNGHAKTNGQANATSSKSGRRKVSQQDIAGLIEQAVQFRTALHNMVQQSSGLVKALKQHRRKSRAIQNTLDSLKQLKTLGV
jgi:hypothetical protein